MTNTQEEYVEHNETYLYHLVIKIDHPTIDPDVITRTLSVEPFGGWRVGEARLTRIGKPMPGIARESYWYVSQRIEGDRLFFEGVNDLLDRVFVPHADFIRTLITEGGTVDITVQLPGSGNIGSILEPETMVKLSNLGIRVGVEVFPHMT